MFSREKEGEEYTATTPQTCQSSTAFEFRPVRGWHKQSMILLMLGRTPSVYLARKRIRSRRDGTM
jgi:hypothetical protein